MNGSRVAWLLSLLALIVGLVGLDKHAGGWIWFLVGALLFGAWVYMKQQEEEDNEAKLDKEKMEVLTNQADQQQEHSETEVNSPTVDELGNQPGDDGNPKKNVFGLIVTIIIFVLIVKAGSEVSPNHSDPNKEQLEFYEWQVKQENGK